MTEREYIEENARRNKAILEEDLYDPITGDHCSGERIMIEIKDAPIPKMWIPSQMQESTLVKNLMKTGSIRSLLTASRIKPDKASMTKAWNEFEKVRFYYDFEYWAATCAYIKRKDSSRDMLFVMNRGQRKVHDIIIRMILAGEPVRVIIDKSRQWGCSTYCTMLLGWYSCVRMPQWNMIVAAHTENTARVIRGMFTKLLRMYPKRFWWDKSAPELRPFEGSQKTRAISGRGNKITVGSAENPTSLVGDDISAVHFSEVSRWAETKGRNPEDLVGSILNGVSLKKDTIVIFESTGFGVGNYFHREWLRAMLDDDNPNKSDNTPIFVPWFLIDNYAIPITDYHKFIAKMTDYEKMLFEMGATLEQVNFYRRKSRSFSDINLFRQDYPSVWQESFASTGDRFYPMCDVERMRKGCRPPEFIGELYGEENTGEKSLTNLKFHEEEGGSFKIWKKPSDEKIADRYVAVMDIGGASERADWSVICVLDRKDMMEGGVPEVVAEWYGHCDHDILAWKAAQVATYYSEAYLVIESNTFEHERTEGDHFDYILDEIAYHYRNLYTRTSASKIKEGEEPVWGFHTNKSTKPMVCDHHRKVLRENMYIERDNATCDEYDVFERKDDGSLGAKQGCHDDKNITRAIGVWVCYQQMLLPRKIERNVKVSDRARRIRMGGSLAVI